MNAPHTRTLSVSVSRLRPTSVSGPYLRAHQPSIQSVAAATTKTISPASQAALTMHANSTTASGIRDADSTFGTLTSDSAGRARPAGAVTAAGVVGSGEVTPAGVGSDM